MITSKRFAMESSIPTSIHTSSASRESAKPCQSTSPKALTRSQRPRRPGAATATTSKLPAALDFPKQSVSPSSPKNATSSAGEPLESLQLSAHCVLRYTTALMLEVGGVHHHVTGSPSASLNKMTGRNHTPREWLKILSAPYLQITDPASNPRPVV